MWHFTLNLYRGTCTCSSTYVIRGSRKQIPAENNFGMAFANIKMFFKGLGLKKLAPVSTRASLFYNSLFYKVSIALLLSLPA
jgi:hypothetical protein